MGAKKPDAFEDNSMVLDKRFEQNGFDLMVRRNNERVDHEYFQRPRTFQDGKRMNTRMNNGIGHGTELWKHILELLLNRNMMHIVKWVNHRGEFCIVNTKELAQSWGNKQNNKEMNHDKLSKAIRNSLKYNTVIQKCDKKWHFRFLTDVERMVQLYNVKIANGEHVQ